MGGVAVTRVVRYAAIAVLAAGSIATAQALDRGKLAPPIQRQTEPPDIPGTARPMRDYLRSSLLVISTVPGGCEAVILHRGEVKARVLPVGDEADTLFYRVFDVPDRGDTWEAEITREGYRSVRLSFQLRPKQLIRAGVLLASGYDADRILFESAGLGGSAIAAVLPDGSSWELVVDTPAADTEPAVAPDGYRVAFCTGQAGDRDIMLFDRRTGTVEPLVADAATDDRRPGWLQDGSVVFERSDGQATWVMLRRTDGVLARLFAARGASDADPAPVPGGSTVLFATTRFGAGWDVAEGNVETGSVRRLTDEAVDERSPAPRPDGAEFAYLRLGPRQTEAALRPIGPPEAGEAQYLGDGAAGLAWSRSGRVLVWRERDAIAARAPGRRWTALPVASGARGSTVAWARFARLPSETPLVTCTLDGGSALIEVDPQSAPRSAANFLELVDRGFYDDCIVHRVDPGLVVQFGCPFGNGTGGCGPPLPLERSSLAPLRGALAPEPEGAGSASSRVFVCLDDLPELASCCAPFARVVRGLDLFERLLPGDLIHSVRRVVFDEEDVPGLLR